MEFALVSIPLLTLLIGMVQYGFYFYVAESASSAASNAARRVVVGDCWGPNAVRDFARNQSPFVSSASYSPSNLTLVSTGAMVTVTVNADGKIIGFLPLPGDGQVTKKVVARLEDKTPSGTCP